jgi:hypothetical protein
VYVAAAAHQKLNYFITTAVKTNTSTSTFHCPHIHILTPSYLPYIFVEFRTVCEFVNNLQHTNASKEEELDNKYISVILLFVERCELSVSEEGYFYLHQLTSTFQYSISKWNSTKY